MNLQEQAAELIRLAYEEDGSRDVTSDALFQDEVKEAVVSSKGVGVICGLKFAEQIAHHVDSSVAVETYLEEGDPVRERMLILGMAGSLKSILRIERILLNFLSRLSGVATITSQFVKAVEKTGAVILDTRKTIPGWRYLDKYAVMTGGGINHRKNLEDIAMIKDTHVDACGGMAEALKRFFEKGEKKPLIVEVRDLQELECALQHVKQLYRIMLDNFSIPLMNEAVKMASGKVLLEASGNITLENARAIAETGVHFLSIGSLTHSAPAFDFSLKIQ